MLTPPTTGFGAPSASVRCNKPPDRPKQRDPGPHPLALRIDAVSRIELSVVRSCRDDRRRETGRTRLPVAIVLPHFGNWLFLRPPPAASCRPLSGLPLHRHRSFRHRHPAEPGTQSRIHLRSWNIGMGGDRDLGQSSSLVKTTQRRRTPVLQPKPHLATHLIWQL